MSIESDLYAALAAVCPRVFPDIAPDGVEAPYVVYAVIGARPLSYVDAAVPDLRNAEVQVSVWAPTRAGANVMALAIEAALIQSVSLNARPSSGMANHYDEDVGLRGASQDFTLWGPR